MDRENDWNLFPSVIRRISAPAWAGTVLRHISSADGGLVDLAVELPTAAGAPPRIARRDLPQMSPDALEAWLRVLERLTGRTGHDVSNPLAAGVGAIDNVVDQETNEDTAEQLLLARDQLMTVRRLLVRQQTLLARPSRDEAERSLVAAIGSAIAAVRVDLRAWDAEPAIEVNDPDMEVVLDAGRLEGIMTALLLNAWEARRLPGRRIEVRAGALPESSDWIQCTVRDDGPGLSPTALQLAGDFLHTTRAHGMGLGLFLARHAASAMGGAVFMRSEENEWTEAGVLLPRRSEPGAQRR